MGLSCRVIRRQLGLNHTVILFVRKYKQTYDVKDRNRSGQPRKTSPQEDCHGRPQKKNARGGGWV